MCCTVSSTPGSSCSKGGVQMKDIVSSLVKSKTGLIGLIIVLLIVLSMLFSPLITS